MTAPDIKREHVNITCNGRECDNEEWVISREKVPEGWASVIVFASPPANKVYLLCPNCLTRMVK